MLNTSSLVPFVFRSLVLYLTLRNAYLSLLSVSGPAADIEFAASTAKSAASTFRIGKLMPILLLLLLMSVFLFLFFFSMQPSADELDAALASLDDD